MAEVYDLKKVRDLHELHNRLIHLSGGMDLASGLIAEMVQESMARLIREVESIQECVGSIAKNSGARFDDLDPYPSPES